MLFVIYVNCIRDKNLIQIIPFPKVDGTQMFKFYYKQMYKFYNKPMYLFYDKQVYKFHKKQMYSTVRNVGRTSLYCVLVELSHLFYRPKEEILRFGEKCRV